MKVAYFGEELAMPAVGKATVKKVNGVLVYSDGSGNSFSFPATTDRPMLLNIDPRIDLLKPIYEQVIKLQARDEAKAAKAKKRKRLAAK